MIWGMTHFNIILTFDLTLHALIHRKALTSKGQLGGVVYTTGLSRAEEWAISAILSIETIRPLMGASNP